MGKWVDAAMARRAEIEGFEDKAAFLDAAGGGTTEVIQSDKIGSDWKVYYVNEVEVRREYVPQEIPVGTADNPFTWEAGMILVPNGYYTFEGVRKVWTGAYGAAAGCVGWDDERFVEF